MRADRGRAHAKLKDRRADGVKAVSRRRRWRVSASLEAGRSPVYFNNPVALNERARKLMANLGRIMPRDREAVFGDLPSLRAPVRVVGRGRRWGVPRPTLYRRTRLI